MSANTNPMRDREDSRAVNVGILGVGERTRVTLSLAFDNRAPGLFEVSSADDADVVIIDMDSAEGPGIWKNYQRNPSRRPVILSSTQPLPIEGVHWVQKPMEFSTLLDALVDVAKEARPG